MVVHLGGLKNRAIDVISCAMEPIELSRVIDQIALSHLEQADHNSPAPSDTFDEASMMKQNAMDFQLFELKFLEATGVHGRLHVNAQQADRQDDPSLIGILEGATNGITQVASRVCMALEQLQCSKPPLIGGGE